MITTILSDFSRVILFPKDTSYHLGLNPLYSQLSQHKHFDFNKHFYFNDKLLNFYKSLKPEISLHIFTSGHIQEDSIIKKKIAPIFDKIVTTEDFEITKMNKDIYPRVLKIIRALPQETIFIDDDIMNIHAAGKAGLQALLYGNNEQVIKQLKLKLDI